MDPFIGIIHLKILLHKTRHVYIYSSTKPIVYTNSNFLVCSIFIISFLATDH